MNNQLWVLLTITVLVLSTEATRKLTSPHFEAFISEYNKTYDTVKEHNERYLIFYANSQIWKRANREPKMLGSGTAVYGMTQFADLTMKEFSDIYLNKVMGTSDIKSVKELLADTADIEVTDIPESVDWRDKGAVTPVKNQGMCGSCWSFSTTGNIEGQYAIQNGTLLSLSEQELLDCDKVDLACNGGLPSQAYLEIKRIGGLELESDYPYKARKGDCKFTKSKAKVAVTGGINLPKDEEKIAAWIAKNGPVSIGINAFMMQFYRGGIAHPWKYLCRPSRLDHGVVITGYGSQGGIPYWTIKNSWGTGWGEDGYYRIYRGGNCCGVSEMVTSATLD